MFIMPAGKRLAPGSGFEIYRAPTPMLRLLQQLSLSWQLCLSPSSTASPPSRLPPARDSYLPLSPLP